MENISKKPLFETLPIISFYVFSIISLFFLSDVIFLLINNGKVSLDISSEKWHNFLSHQIRFMQNLIFFYSFICLFSKKIKIKDIVYVIPFAYLEVSYSFFGQFVHPFLLNIGFYNLFSDNIYNVSPEYSRVIFFILILFAYLISFIKSKYFKSIFLFLSMGAIFFTSLLFHTITIKQLNYFTSQQEESIKRLAFETKENNFNDKCILLNLSCFIYINNNKNPFDALQEDSNNINNLENNTIKNLTTLNSIVNNYRSNIEDYFLNSQYYFYYTISNDNSVEDRITSRTPVAFVKNENLIAFIIDSNNYKKYLYFNQLIFEVLSFFSHFTWLVGALYLIYFHDKRLKKKINKKSL